MSSSKVYILTFDVLCTNRGITDKHLLTVSPSSLRSSDNISNKVTINSNTKASGTLSLETEVDRVNKADGIVHDPFTKETTPVDAPAG